MKKIILILLLLLSLTSCSTQVSEDSNVNDHINSNKALEIARKKGRTLEQYGIRGFHSREEIIQILEKAREAGTLNASGYNLLGFEYHNQGRFKNAIESFEKSLELDPEYVEVYYFLGLSYWESELKDKLLAIKTMEKALDLCKQNPEEFKCESIVQGLASQYLVCKNCLGKEKNMQKVIDYANEGLHLINKDSNLKFYTRFHFLIGKAYSKLSGKENLLRARQAFKEVLKYKDQPWYESARDDLEYVEQDLRFINERSGGVAH